MKPLWKSTLALCPLLLAGPPTAYAGCDPCIQAAAQGANGQMTAALQATTTSVQANVSATNALNAALQAASTALQTTVNLNTQQFLQGLSASTNRIEGAIQQNTKAVERMADHTVNSMVQALTEVLVAEQTDRNNKIYGEKVAHPVSGDIGANRAPLLKQGIVQSDQVWQEMTKSMHDWNNNTVDVEQGGAGIKKSVLLTEESGVWNPVPLIAQRQITQDESRDLQKLLTLLVNPVPLPTATDEQLASGNDAENYELGRRLLNAKLELAHAVLAKSIADKQPLIPMSADNWQKGYVMAEADAEGKVSVLSMLESETVGRLGSEGWYQDIKGKTPAGILREQVYQQAINNQLLLRLVEQDEQRLTMLALLAITELEQSRPIPPANKELYSHVVP